MTARHDVILVSVREAWVCTPLDCRQGSDALHQEASSRPEPQTDTEYGARVAEGLKLDVKEMAAQVGLSYTVVAIC